MNQLKHIGIASITAEGGALAFREIVHFSEKFLGKNIHPEISLHSHSFSRFTDTIETRSTDWKNLIIASAHKLASAGADFMICPSNTNHLEFDLVADELPIPWLHIAATVTEEALSKRFKKSLLLGTRYLVSGGMYSSYFSKMDLEIQLPTTEEIELIHTVIYEELIRGIFTEQSKEAVIDVVHKYVSTNRCDSIILGCTELPLLLTAADVSVPILDSTRILARGAVARACGVTLVEIEKKLMP